MVKAAAGLDYEEEIEEEDEESEEDTDEIFYEIYVEIATNLIHEVQFFDTFCLVRPASPSLYLAIRKLNLMDFSRDFREYLGDANQVRTFLRNQAPDIVVD